MSTLIKDIVLNAVKLPPNWTEHLAEFAAKKLGVAPAAVTAAEVLAAATDSRRGTPKLLLTIQADVAGIPASPPEEFAAFAPQMPEIPEKTTLDSPLVIGTGPAGIFGAWVLAKAGCRPVIIDRGAPVGQRAEDYRNFIRTRQLDEESNLLIGEGGAGTFSDGKLYTGTKDRRAGWVRHKLVECGAPPEIIWKTRAHVGSDYLQLTAANLRREIENLGGKFLFHTEVTGIKVKNGRFHGVHTASGEFLEAPSLLLAPGLGGRNLLRQLMQQADWELKPFQIGCRIEHPQHLIDRSMYHISRPAALGAAEYHLVSRKYPRHTASFCMCPGGEVVNATAWRNHSISNGMSLFARAGEFANSCLISTFAPGELGSAGNVFELIDQLETACFQLGGGDYTLPAQDAAGFLRRELTLKNRKTSAATGITPGRIDAAIPSELFNALSSALRDFDHRIPGWIKQGKFIGIESCVSAPVRLLRNRETLESSIAALYPAGEGCGAAGGIISAACDGIRCAEAMLKRFC
ncbi:MAG: hypothetical protein IJW35_06575 [Lentisphaeria bacterium]|nr:hypothetical protein [Lentisphaeria bacterium]